MGFEYRHGLVGEGNDNTERASGGAIFDDEMTARTREGRYAHCDMVERERERESSHLCWSSCLSTEGYAGRHLRRIG